MDASTNEMNEYKLKEQMCEIGRRVYAKGFAAANDGNITVRLNEREFLCTPTMVSKGFLKPEDICKVDIEGKQLAGTQEAHQRGAAAPVHLQTAARHQRRPSTVIRRTPPPSPSRTSRSPSASCPKSRSFSARCRIAVYETPGGQKFADTVVPFAKDCNTILLANHGTITFGPDLEQAYWNTEIIDAYCRILILAKQLGRINYFDEQKTRELLGVEKAAGLRRRALPR